MTYEEHVAEIENNPCVDPDCNHNGYHNDTSCPPHSGKVCKYILEKMGIENPSEALNERVRELERDYRAVETNWRTARYEYERRLQEYREWEDKLAYFEHDHMTHSIHLCFGDHRVLVSSSVWHDLHRNSREGALQIVDLVVKEYEDD